MLSTIWKQCIFHWISSTLCLLKIQCFSHGTSSGIQSKWFMTEMYFYKLSADGMQNSTFFFTQFHFPLKSLYQMHIMLISEMLDRYTFGKPVTGKLTVNMTVNGVGYYRHEMGHPVIKTMEVSLFVFSCLLMLLYMQLVEISKLVLK